MSTKQYCYVLIYIKTLDQKVCNGKWECVACAIAGWGLLSSDSFPSAKVKVIALPKESGKISDANLLPSSVHLI